MQLCSPHELSQATAVFIIAWFMDYTDQPSKLSLCLKTE
ncbi:hypothetical protein WM41_2201 [Corynebacterium simulans]|uniref:Uncharacterized protein n=1 Tax=Corynebacterium simulans TaxID=146827 RepID=A0ABR5V6Z4_9CORY|nr:hypothetical protein WM41_2201 [Corynebacterium simulans]